ncbi:hypothetical protein D3C72_1431420 [compost metagenome]
MAVIACLHLDGARADFLRGERIDGKRVFGIDDRLARPHQRMGGQLQDVVAAVAERQPFGRDIVLRRKLRLQLETVTVRIAAQLIHRRRNRGPGGGRHAERVLIRGQLDDTRLVEPELTRHLGNRLASDVRRDLSHIGRPEIVGGILRVVGGAAGFCHVRSLNLTCWTGTSRAP